MLNKLLKKLKKENIDEIVETYAVKKEKYGGDISMESSEGYYPSIHLSSKTLPEIKEWEVDGEYFILMKVTQKFKSMKTEGKEEVYHGCFDIKEIGYIDHEEVKEKKKHNSKDDISKIYT